MCSTDLQKKGHVLTSTLLSFWSYFQILRLKWNSLNLYPKTSSFSPATKMGWKIFSGSHSSFFGRSVTTTASDVGRGRPAFLETQRKVGDIPPHLKIIKIKTPIKRGGKFGYKKPNAPQPNAFFLSPAEARRNFHGWKVLATWRLLQENIHWWMKSAHNRVSTGPKTSWCKNGQNAVKKRFCKVSTSKTVLDFEVISSWRGSRLTVTKLCLGKAEGESNPGLEAPCLFNPLIEIYIDPSEPATCGPRSPAPIGETLRSATCSRCATVGIDRFPNYNYGKTFSRS